jgi:hypothetical protein
MPDHAASEGSVALRPPAAAEGTHLPSSSVGQPLDRATRAFMEPRFGQDFSRVRVHTDSAAAESARSLGAFAFTTGHDIVFGPGRYAPATREGKHLLAHELSHVAQPGPYAIARRADPAAVAKMDARTIMADPDYIENGLVRMEYFAAEQARLYYKDGASLLIGLVPRWLTPPMKSVDIHSTRADIPVVQDDRELKYIPDARKLPGKLTYPEILAKYTQTAKFSVDAGSGKIIPDALNAVTAPFLCAWLRETELQWTANFDAMAAGMVKILEVMKLIVELQLLRVSMGGPKTPTPKAPPVAAGGEVVAETSARILSRTFGRSLAGARTTLQQLEAGTYQIPAGLTRQMLLEYQGIAQRAIAAGKDTLGVQALRLQIIEKLLPLLK